MLTRQDSTNSSNLQRGPMQNAEKCVVPMPGTAPAGGATGWDLSNDLSTELGLLNAQLAQEQTAALSRLVDSSWEQTSTSSSPSLQLGSVEKQPTWEPTSSSAPQLPPQHPVLVLRFGGSNSRLPPGRP
ncbi:hypothetical protein THAOC_08924 [Thalassiosira oceanica]|uniref:Uncharacterized protein n=1 Tax=Thalassiosira oceanica TaxID=159749 RepID=K0T8U2_THAOC|nr:hypothetical protein THAOC_08924 [Thalassiosira oceanica]|eukprot:EJK69781.1 hypothetical protein THAOC_08924 [Thalassiosira oceanica]